MRAAKSGGARPQLEPAERPAAVVRRHPRARRPLAHFQQQRLLHACAQRAAACVCIGQRRHAPHAAAYCAARAMLARCCRRRSGAVIAENLRIRESSQD